MTEVPQTHSLTTEKKEVPRAQLSASACQAKGGPLLLQVMREMELISWSIDQKHRIFLGRAGSNLVHSPVEHGVPASSRIFTPLSRIMTVRLLESSNAELTFESAMGLCNLVQLCRCFTLSEKRSGPKSQPMAEAFKFRCDTGSYIVMS